MTNVQIVCACGQLIAVVDKQIVEHNDREGERCWASAQRYIPSKGHVRRASGPQITTLFEGVLPYPCETCGEPIPFTLGKAVFPDPSNN